MRIDRLLWFLRLLRSRTSAQALIAEGHIRLNHRRVERASQPAALGDVLVVPLGERIRIIEIIALPHRRGPAAEAQGCYRVLDETPPDPIAAQANRPAAKSAGRAERAATEDLQP